MKTKLKVVVNTRLNIRLIIITVIQPQLVSENLFGALEATSESVSLNMIDSKEVE